LPHDRLQKVLAVRSRLPFAGEPPAVRGDEAGEKRSNGDIEEVVNRRLQIL